MTIVRLLKTQIGGDEVIDFTSAQAASQLQKKDFTTSAQGGATTFTMDFPYVAGKIWVLAAGGLQSINETSPGTGAWTVNNPFILNPDDIVVAFAFKA